MGKFTERIRRQQRNKNKPKSKDVEFACGNCLNVFTFAYSDIYLKLNGDLEFSPEPECPRCGATEELVFSDYGQEKIEEMLFSNQIKKQELNPNENEQKIHIKVMNPPPKEIKLNKEQFKLFNDDDQFQLFCDDDGFPNYQNFNEEVDKLFRKYDYICVTEDNFIYGDKNGKREVLSDQAFEGFAIATEVIENQ